MASKEETPLSQTQPSPIAQKRKSSAHVQPDSLKAVIVEDTESEELAIVESKAFTKGKNNDFIFVPIEYITNNILEN